MFVIRTFEARTLSWWYDQREFIDMNPLYQRRGAVWSATDRSFLIDSVLNGYDIPKLYIADFSSGSTLLNARRLPYAVIDGKQRLEALFGFFDGTVTLAKGFVFLDDPVARLGGLTLKDLRVNHPKLASRFENFNLSVTAVVTDEEARINELFIRLNRSRPLTGAELRNAMGGIVPALIRDLTRHPFFHSAVRFPMDRGEDQNAAAKLLLLEFLGGFTDTKKVDLDRFAREGARAEAETDDFERAADRVAACLYRMMEVFTPHDPLLRSQGIVPVYYWLVREAPEGLLGAIRARLVGFEEARIGARRAAREHPGIDVPQILTWYEALSRSVNDQRSLAGRYQILSRVIETEDLEGLERFR